MKLVIIESPLGTNADGSRCTPEQFKRNQEYVNACMLDCLRNQEVPFASHAIYPLVLKDADPGERKLGMDAGFAIGKAFAYAQTYSKYYKGLDKEPVETVAAFYADRGTSSGVEDGLKRHRENGIMIEIRHLGTKWSNK